MQLQIIEKKAAEFREKWGLGTTEPIVLKSLLQKLNVITLFKPLSPNFSGMAIKAEENRFMLINANHSFGRQRFSICHELYHLFVQENFTPHQSSAGNEKSEDKEERNADLFASNLLLPKDGLIKHIPDEELLKKDKITLGTIISLEQYFGCSRAALLGRLKELKLVSKDHVSKFYYNVKKSALEYGYSIKIYEPHLEETVIGDYGQKAKKLFDAEKISEGHYHSLMSAIGIDLLNLDDLSDED
ncbi:ImmA/IrrE family metallo-endopeptidase [Flammeovirga sp. OC4]|uniref:ImmA/IrrE family metallo-endopeptidase n=1 Tax=Flammeovirga sp. OC4 TaxID=1382345 RepID=UPI0005C5C564|nr:ImmA/IrrE family metallo-endopeptidase [Flammeovirga sp. OC4]